MRWYGWARLTPTAPWRLLATGHSLETCHRALERELWRLRLRLPSLATAMTGGAAPTWGAAGALGLGLGFDQV